MVAGGSVDTVQVLAAQQPGLGALVLFGSRARGEAAATSDWDFGYLADREFDPAAFLAAIVYELGTEEVDLVDLSTASGLLRFRAARDGRLLWGDERLIEHFRLEAASFWCDAEPAFCADMLDESNEEFITMVTKMLEPLILIIMGFVVGGVAISLFVPLFDMTSAIK